MEASPTTPTPTENEISYDQALGEQGESFGDTPPTPRPRPQQQAVAAEPPQQQEIQNAPPQPAPEQTATEAAADEAKEAIDILAPKTAAREWTFGQGENSLVYVQRELSVISKTQWFALVGEILDSALGGENSISLNSILSPPQQARPGALSMQDFQDADTFVHAMGKLLIFAPEFLEKSICIWLSVPDYEWDLVRSIMRQSPELGGLSDDSAEEIIATFIDQNYASLSTFFRDRFGHLRDRWNARAKDLQSRSPRR